MNTTKCAQRLRRLQRLGLAKRDPRLDMHCLFCEPPATVTLVGRSACGKTEAGLLGNCGELPPGFIRRDARRVKGGGQCGQ